MKKTWQNPAVADLSIGNTEYHLTGIYRDGGYIGDGIISGHGTWKKPSCPGEQPSVRPEES